MLHEEIADLRHKETESYIGCIVGFVMFLAGFTIRFPSAAGAANLALAAGGFLLIIVSGISSLYYSEKRKSLMKKISNAPNVPSTIPPPPSNICPTCRHALTFIEQYKAWYCFNCKEYK
jgi:hypothetical protein